MDDPDEETVLHYNVDTQQAWFDEEADQEVNGPFVGETAATRFTVGPGVTEIGDYTFYENPRLSSLQGMGENVTKIGMSAFTGTGLTSLQGMSKNVTEIGDNGFSSCKNLISLEGMSESVTVISALAFHHCTSLTSLEGLPESLTTLGTLQKYGGLIGGVFADCFGLTSLQGLPRNITELGDECFSWCFGMTSLQGGEYVTVLGNEAFFNCANLTTLQGLSRNVTSIGDTDSMGYGAFRNCFKLASIGPGFSPSCFVHPHSFDNCPALLAAAEAKGFASAIEWGRHHWLTPRRYTVLTAVRQVRRSPPSAVLASPLLSLLAGAPDDMVRVIVGFMGEGVEESAQEREARWELTAFKQSREIRRQSELIGQQRERVERLEERVEQQRGQMEEREEHQRERVERLEQQREQTEERMERLEELLRRELEGRGSDGSGRRRVRQKKEE